MGLRCRVGAMAAGVLLACLPARADVASETALKTAFAYNFIVLSTWPADARPVLRFCVAGTAGPHAAFHALAGKSVRERTLSVAQLSSSHEAAGCDILYVPAAEGARLETWLAPVAKLPVLTISEQAPTLDAIVNLRVTRERIVFDVNTQAAAAARIVLSSQLIKLAASRK